MRFLLAVLLILIGASLAEYVLPWWSAAAVAFLVAFLLRLAPGRAFCAGLLGLLGCWLGWALWRDIPNDHLLSGRMARVFSLPGYGAFIALTAVLGALVGGLGAWSGAHAGRLLRPGRQNRVGGVSS